MQEIANKVQGIVSKACEDCEFGNHSLTRNIDNGEWQGLSRSYPPDSKLDVASKFLLPEKCVQT
jgi:hypothetical protein